jgi:copper homeostasis protein
MIRPRSGDFIYSDEEFLQMKKDIENFKAEASGFVFGILTEGNQLDRERNTELVQLAAPLPCTYHRAFDQVQDMFEATEQIIECGFKSILTSGGPSNAVDGAKTVAELQKKLGDKIEFILGGGVRSGNIGFLKRRTNADWYHSAAITKPGETVDTNEIEQLKRIDATAPLDRS